MPRAENNEFFYDSNHSARGKTNVVSVAVWRFLNHAMKSSYRTARALIPANAQISVIVRPGLRHSTPQQHNDGLSHHSEKYA